MSSLKGRVIFQNIWAVYFSTNYSKLSKYCISWELFHAVDEYAFGAPFMGFVDKQKTVILALNWMLQFQGVTCHRDYLINKQYTIMKRCVHFTVWVESSRWLQWLLPSLSRQKEKIWTASHYYGIFVIQFHDLGLIENVRLKQRLMMHPECNWCHRHMLGRERGVTCG